MGSVMVRLSIGAAGITTSSTTASSSSAHASAGMSASAAAPAAPPSAARREACRLSLFAAPLLLHVRFPTRQKQISSVSGAGRPTSPGSRSLSKPGAGSTPYWPCTSLLPGIQMEQDSMLSCGRACLAASLATTGEVLRERSSPLADRPHP
jgi:hypothetical protein